MDNAGHLGIAFANIVYSILATIDFEEYDLSLSRFFEEDSCEKKTLIAFLMKRKAMRFFNDIVNGEMSDGDDSITMVTVMDDVDNGDCGESVKENGDVITRALERKREKARCRDHDVMKVDGKSQQSIPSTTEFSFFERSLAINDIVMQLTIVRNAFLRCILHNSNCNFFGCSNYTLHAMYPIVIPSSRTLHENGIRSIFEVVSSLSKKLMSTFLLSFSTGSCLQFERGNASFSNESFCNKNKEKLCGAVEVIWAFSLCFILAPRGSELICSGGLVYCNRFFFRDQAKMHLSGELSTNQSFSSFVPHFLFFFHVPPVFFLSCELAMRLNSYFYDVLISAESSRSIPGGMRLLLLSRCCYGLLSQIDKKTGGYKWKEVVQRCATAMKMAHVSSHRWEDADWSRLFQQDNQLLSNTECEVMARRLAFIWRQRQRLVEDTVDGDSQISESLPFFFSGDFPSFFSSQFTGATALALSLGSLLKSSGGGSKGDKSTCEILSTLFGYTLNICHLFSHNVEAYEIFKDLLEFVKKIVAFSKKEKRLREVVTLALSGCLFSQPRGYVDFHCNAERQYVSYLQEVIESLLNEISSWCKLKNATLYSLSVSALLGGCSVNTLTGKIPFFFLTMESWLTSADNVDRVAILYATLHAGGLISDSCLSNDDTLSCEWAYCIESFCYYVEKMLVNVIGCESWLDTHHSSSCVEAASDLLLFALQQELFYLKACNWIRKLLATKTKTKMLGKRGGRIVISRGQLIALRTISVLLDLYYYGRSCSFVCNKRHDATNCLMVLCTSLRENGRNFNAVYNTALEQKTSGKERIIGFITLHGSCYRPVVSTLEGLAFFWYGNRLETVFEFINSSPDIQTWVKELRNTAFDHVRYTCTNNSTEEAIEDTRQLVPIFLISRFWGAPHLLLDKDFTLPMLLLRPRSPLYDAVFRVVFPYYLAGKSNEGMLCCALVLHRLAECIIDFLGKDEVEHVVHLAEYLTSQLLVLRDKMASIVNDELYSQKKKKRDACVSAKCVEKKPAHSDDMACQRIRESIRARWGWLFNSLDTSIQLSESFSEYKIELSDWVTTSGTHNVALIDTLEGLAVVLLGHPTFSVRQAALKQLELFSSFMHLKRVDIETSLYAGDDGGIFSASQNLLLWGNSALSDCIGKKEALCSKDLFFSRAMVADIFGELGEQFEEMYLLHRDYYVSFTNCHEQKIINATTPMSGNVEFKAKGLQGLRAEPSAGLSGVKNTTDSMYSLSMLALRKSLATTPFGLRCLSNDKSTPLFVFTSALALSLLTYGYCAGSALVRIVCAISGEVVVKGAKLFKERSASVWGSCYVLNFLLLLVDNVNVSPDADRLTRGSVRNRPGHQQCGCSTFVDGPGTASDISWQIVNRYAEYNKLINDVTLSLIIQEIGSDNGSMYFIDLVQFLFIGPLGYVSAGDTALVTFAGMVESDHPILTSLQDFFLPTRRRSRKLKACITHGCLTILLSMLLCLGRRHFVRPPCTPGWIQSSVATKRAYVETILQTVIEGVLSGYFSEKEHAENCQSKRRLSVSALGRYFSEGQSGSTHAMQGFSLFSSFNNSSNATGGMHGENRTCVSHDAASDLTSVIILRGVLCDLITLVYSKETKFLEQQLKKTLLMKVLYSLTCQVQWFLQVDASQSWKEFGAIPAGCMKTAVEKSIFALQTVLSSLEQLASDLQRTDYARIITMFSKRFFQWLQESLSSDHIDLESSAPSVFGLAVTLVIVDPKAWETVLRVLCELPMDNPVHCAFFSVIVTAVSSKWAARQKPLLTAENTLRRRIFWAMSATSNSNETTSSIQGSTYRNDIVLEDAANIGGCIYYALAYLDEDVALEPTFDTKIRSKAQTLLELMCGGESPVETNTSLTDDWFCLLLKIYRQNCVDVGGENDLVQSLFTMASKDILSAESKTSGLAKLHRIALKLLSFFSRRVSPTESNLRILLDVTKVTQKTCSEQALATLWGGWIAYEGRERERFVSLLVMSAIDLTDKRLITYYIDSYVTQEMLLQKKKQNGKLTLRSRSAYYSFLLFSLYQMGLLRNSLVFCEQIQNSKLEAFVDSWADSLRRNVNGNDSTMRFSRSFSTSESHINKKLTRSGNVKPKFLWIIQENIWRVSLKLTNEKFKVNFDTQSCGQRNREAELSEGTESKEVLTTLYESSFVKPLVNVLYFASWAIERLWSRDCRLWDELHKDLKTMNDFTTEGFLADMNLCAGSDTLFLSSEDGSEIRSDRNNDDDDHLFSEADPTQSNDQCSLVSDLVTATTTAAVKSKKKGIWEKKKEDEEEEEEVGKLSDDNSNINNNNDGNDVVDDDGSDCTRIVHSKIPITSVTKAMIKNMKQEERLKKKETFSRHKEKNSVSFSFCHRDFLALFLHSACMLLVHIGCGNEGGFEEECNALSSRFYVVEMVFELLLSMLRGTALERTCRSSSTFKRWLKITFARLRHREMMQLERRNLYESNYALIFEPSLLFEKSDIEESLSGSVSSAAEIVLTEFFLGIVGHGSNLRGRHFLLRCLHESSKWLRRGECAKFEFEAHLHVLYSYISLLSMKITRVLSSCLSFTTGAVIVGCLSRQLWMEKTAMLLASASAFRRLCSAFSCYISAFCTGAFTTDAVPTPTSNNTLTAATTALSVHTHHRVLCTSILSSLGCILRDIIIHETYYSTVAHARKAEKQNNEALLLATAFGDKSAFPARYLLSSFWIGFAFLLVPEMWLAACDLLAVFHRYGCAHFLGTISFPLLSSPHQLNTNVAPDCAAVQLVLLRQGNAAFFTLIQRAAENVCRDRSISRDAMDVVLSYVDEYASEKEETALLLAFSELLLLCDWHTLDIETHAPRFAALVRRPPAEDSQGQLYRASSNTRSLYEPSSFAQFLYLLIESWKQSLLVLPIGFERSAQGLLKRMTFVLEEFFKAAVRRFGAFSVDVLLHRVKGAKTGCKVRFSDCTSMNSKHENTDLCSLHSCDNHKSNKEGGTDEGSTLSFQRHFESLVMYPLMSLFQSPQTPLPLWSKILAFVAALLRYHEKNHGFITDQLLKFLPDIERGLTTGSVNDSFTDETPLNERLVVLVLADEVSAKVSGLLAGPSFAVQPPVIRFDKRKGLPLFESFLTDESVVPALVDALSKDCAFISLTTNSGHCCLKDSAVGEEGNKGEPLMTSSSTKVAVNGKTCLQSTFFSVNDEMSCELSNSHTSALFQAITHQSDDDDDDDSSSLIMQKISSVKVSLRSHRFGEYVYEYFFETSGAVPAVYQLPLEYYYSQQEAFCPSFENCTYSNAAAATAINNISDDASSFITSASNMVDTNRQSFFENSAGSSDEDTVDLGGSTNASRNRSTSFSHSLSTLNIDDRLHDDDD